MPAPADLLLVAAVFLVAGGVKGVVGMGLPTVAMGVLGLAMPPAQAAALLVVPALVTNAWQMIQGPALGPLLRRLAPMMLAMAVGTVAGIPLMTGAHAARAGLFLGLMLVVYALVGLFLPRLQVPPRRQVWLGPVVGGLTGIVTGATGLFVVPSVPYLGALGLSRDELVQALGLSFTTSTVALALALGGMGAWTASLALASAAAVLPTLGGMLLGQVLRDRMNAETFRRCFLFSMLLVGAYLGVRGAWRW